MIPIKGPPVSPVAQETGDGGSMLGYDGEGDGLGNVAGHGSGEGNGCPNGDGYSQWTIGILNGDWVGGEGCVVRGGL